MTCLQPGMRMRWVSRGRVAAAEAVESVDKEEEMKQESCTIY